MAVRDDGGGGCAIVLLGQQHYWGVRAVVGMGWQARHCQGRRAVVMESTMTTRMADDATGGEGWTTMTSNKSSCLTTQGNSDGSNNGSRDVMLRASYSQRCLLKG